MHTGRFVSLVKLFRARKGLLGRIRILQAGRKVCGHCVTVKKIPNTENEEGREKSDEEGGKVEHTCVSQE